MTIDEAIEEYKKRVENDRQAESLYLHDDLIWNAKQENKLAEHHEQLAKWLEEFKALKSDDNLIFGDGLEQGYEEGYNKAIDDFLREIKIDVIATTFGLRICDAERIAQQLKEGAVDGNSTTDN